MDKYIINLSEISKKSQPIAGGKEVNLGELKKLVSAKVPSGFYLTNNAYNDLK
jgi:phosphoenolpyruvate synthase/pyruvate phosphate dikinase